MTNNKVKVKLEHLIKLNKMHIADSKKFWEEKQHSHAFIVGYLERALVVLVNELEEMNDELSA